MGLDFMQKHQMGLVWLDTGKGLLTLEDKVLVETVNVCEIGPQLMTYSSLALPPRTLSVINVHVDLKGNSTDTHMKSNQTVCSLINAEIW